ncbi:hypothetical protein D3C85_1924830 [compost metagenome]
MKLPIARGINPAAGAGPQPKRNSPASRPLNWLISLAICCAPLTSRRACSSNT